MPEWALSVSELNEYVRLKLAGDPMLRQVSVRGEISGFKRHVSGHLYFTLKDDSARVNCCMFRSAASTLDFRPEDGYTVVATGSAGLYAASGSYQLYVESLRREGAGDLFMRFEELKRRLAAEGLFDASVKKPLPLTPHTIGVVTSKTGAAFRDIIRVARARNPLIDIIIAPCSVQGTTAANEIAAAVEMLDKSGKADVILCGRGGGSIEDLWAFNEEAVARAIYACKTPVISCVGHETDFTIADFVADIRAATPSNAAELAVCDVSETRAALVGMRARLSGAVKSAQRRKRDRLAGLMRSPCILSPTRMLTERKRSALNDFNTRLSAAYTLGTEKRRHALNIAENALNALNPDNVLKRGYARVSVSGSSVSDARELSPRDTVRIDMRDAAFTASVSEILERNDI